VESGGESVWPADLHSYADLTTAKSEGLRLSRAEEADEDRTMKQLAEALEVTPRRITVLVDALEEHGLAERYPHPTGGRSTVVAITDAGLKAQRLGCQQHQDKVAVAFADLPQTISGGSWPSHAT
jgi:DNA-binding MarR family transcriptional regulator